MALTKPDTGPWPAPRPGCIWPVNHSEHRNQVPCEMCCRPMMLISFSIISSSSNFHRLLIVFGSPTPCPPKKTKAKNIPQTVDLSWAVNGRILVEFDSH